MFVMVSFSRKPLMRLGRYEKISQSQGKDRASGKGSMLRWI